MRHLALLCLLGVLLACASVISETTEPAVDLCSARSVDANSVGVTTARRTVLTFDESMLQAGGPLPPSNGCGRALRTSHRLVVRYTPHANARLRVSVETQGSRVDRIVVLDACGASSRRLSCSGTSYDDLQLAVLPAVTETAVRAGAPLTVAVALDEGAGSVIFDEVPDARALGERCDQTQVGNVCERGSSCSGALTPRCVADGAPYAGCRRSGAPCETGLVCRNPSRDGVSGLCVPARHLGERCDGSTVCVDGYCERPSGAVDGRCVAQRRAGGLGERCNADGSCSAGLRCQATGSFGEGVCWPVLPSRARCRSVARGSSDGGVAPEALCPAGEECSTGEDGVSRCARVGGAWGQCREGLRCDAGLSCVVVGEQLECVPPRMEGQPCDASAASACPAGTRCTRGDDASSRCRRYGALGGPCVQFHCDDGLACSGAGVCQAPLPLGVPCTSEWECGPLAACLADPVTMGRVCVARGAAGGRARSTAPPCDAGLAVGADGRCFRALGRGDVCAEVRDAACAAPLRCDQTCRDEGADGGYCRASSPSCDEGLTCLNDAFWRAPVCVREIRSGERCDALRDDRQTVIGDCVGATECASLGESIACAPLAPSLVACSESEPRCPTGMSCVLGVCARVAAIGARCDNGSTRCPEDATCEGAPSVCVANGVAQRPCRSTGAPCDAGLSCETFASGAGGTYQRCIPVIAEGATCDGLRTSAVCERGTSCQRARCVRDGAEGGACRQSPSACDGELSCARGLCARATAEGEMCSNASEATGRCAEGLSCLGDRTSTRCSPSSYRVEVRQGVAFEDPCRMALSGTTSPLVLTLGGETFRAEVTPANAVVLRDEAGAEQSLDIARPDDVERVNRPYVGCARIVGEAPSRRLLVGGGLWARGLDALASVAYEEVFYEGSDVIEIRYAAPSPEGRAWVTPRLVTRRETLNAPRIQPVAGTSVRFVPQ